MFAGLLLACGSPAFGQPKDTIRIGYFEYWPLTITEKNSKPSGFMVELFEEVARRERVRVEWVQGRDPSDRSDQSDVDLWPLHPPTIDKSQDMFLTEPWWTSQVEVVYLADHEPPEIGSFTGSLGHVNFPAQNDIVQRFFPHASAKPFGKRTEVENALCTSQIEAALMGEYRLQNFLLERPPGCREMNLRFITVPGANAQLSILSRRANSAQAIRFRKRLNDLAADGTMARLVDRYPSAASGITMYMADLQRERSTRNLLLFGMAGLVLLLIITGYFITRLRRDIERRYRVEAQLRLNQQALEQSIDGIAILHQDGTISTCNLAFASMHGYSREELCGRNMELLSGGDDQNWLSNVFETGSFEGGRLQLRRDGEAFTAHVSASVLHDESGKSTGAVIVAHDKTRELQLEAELRQSQKMEAVGRLAGGVAHDFNNLLTIINGYCELLLASENPPAERQMIEAVRDAGERATSLTRQLLYVSRKQVTQPRQLSLNDSIQDTLKMLQRLIGEDIQVAPDLDPSDPYVVIDPGQLNQILMNLALNARDAMPSGGTLSFLTSTETVPASGSFKAGDYAVLTVVDTGVGITPDVQRRIFEPFFTTKRTGTGLGLATVDSIVRAAGGWIQVASEFGRGSRFTVFLPLSTEKTHEPAKTAPAAPATPGKGTILLAEDQPEVRRFTAEALRGIGYTVLEAEDGDSALSLAARTSDEIDLLITDLVMPGMGGRELAHRLVASRTALKIIFISGYPDSEFAAGDPHIPAIFLPKPFTVGVLARKVAEVLEPAGVILVVDDEANLRAYLRSILEDRGFQVFEAANGRDAIARVESVHPSVVIMDLAMPGQEGIETIRVLTETHPSLHIIAMSGAFGPEMLEVARSLGAKAALQKPISGSELLAALPAYLRPDSPQVGAV